MRSSSDSPLTNTSKVRLPSDLNPSIGKVLDSCEQSVIKVFEENVLPSFNKYNSNEFRWQRLWNEPCDIVLKKNLKTLKELY